ncbi:MAG: crotonase/enoyl-CoA hydratase family protein [Myxococcales bacterium]|nr:crotonase/enoyl-CoA hydratase family protein [Myxococcales bacterium]
MTSGLIEYVWDEDVAVIRMDDGRVNALSLEMLGEINRALDDAETREVPLILSGRTGVFSAGFDLKSMRKPNLSTLFMIREGFRLSARLLSHPQPVVIACTGHAVAMGAFLLLSGDYRVAARGPWQIVANEVGIGMTVPRAGVELCRFRLAPNHLQRALTLAEPYSPDEAVEAGFVDEVVEAGQLEARVRALAAESKQLDKVAHRNTKRRARRAHLGTLRSAIWKDSANFAWMGVTLAAKKALSVRG